MLAASLSTACVFLLLQPAAAAQDSSPPAAGRVVDVEADRKAAVEALAQLIKAYRDPKGVAVEISVGVGAASGAGRGGASPVRMKATFADNRRALIGLRDYQLRLAGGRIIATHDSNPLAYLDVSDHGSPYYALFNAFQALPIPELALALGEESPEEVCMQLMPQIPDVLPLRVEDEEVDGQAAKVLVLQSDDASQELRLSFDPDTKLVERSVAYKRGGPEAEEGASLEWRVESRAMRPKNQPDDKTFALDVSGKQKVDGLAALVNRDPGATADRDVEALKAGEPAPALALPKLGGGDWDIVAARPRPVVVDFWATWCGPCKAALPGLAKLAKEFEGKADFMMVNAGEQGTREEREQNIRKVFGSAKVDLPCVLDLDGLAARRWLIGAFPTTFVVAPDGKIAGVWVGSSPRSEREIHELLVKLTAPAAK